MSGIVAALTDALGPTTTTDSDIASHSHLTTLSRFTSLVVVKNRVVGYRRIESLDEALAMAEERLRLIWLRWWVDDKRRSASGLERKPTEAAARGYIGGHCVHP
jgi:hypothetical protein